MSLTVIQMGSITAIPFPKQKIHCGFPFESTGMFLKKKMTGMEAPGCAALIGCFSPLNLSSLFQSYLVGRLRGRDTRSVHFLQHIAHDDGVAVHRSWMINIRRVELPPSPKAQLNDSSSLGRSEWGGGTFSCFRSGEGTEMFTDVS